MTVYILFFIFHVIIYGPRVCNKHLKKERKIILKLVDPKITLPLSSLYPTFPYMQWKVSREELRYLFPKLNTYHMKID